MNKRKPHNSGQSAKRVRAEVGDIPSDTVLQSQGKEEIIPSEYENRFKEVKEVNLKVNDTVVIGDRSYTMRPARILVSVEGVVDCKSVSEMLQALCLHCGLMVVCDVYDTEAKLICYLNANRYDLVFVHQTLIYGKQGDRLILNLRCLLSFTPVIVMGISNNYASLMSLCDFTAFLRVPFSNADFLHYILKYIFEPYESKVFHADLQKIPKKQRLRSDVMKLLNAKNPAPAKQVVGIPVQVDFCRGKSKNLYKNTSQFVIPDCYQLPMDPSASQKKMWYESRIISVNPPEPITDDDQEDYIEYDPLLRDDILPNLIKPFEEKMPKKRVSAGMRLVRENIDLFVEESAELLSRFKMCNVTYFPQPLALQKRKGHTFISIAPRK